MASGWPISRSRFLNHGNAKLNGFPPLIRSNSIGRRRFWCASSWPITPDSPRRAASTAKSTQPLMSVKSSAFAGAERAKYPDFWTSNFSAPIISANCFPNHYPGFIASSMTCPNASRGTSSPFASISLMIASTPAPSEMKIFTQS